MGEPRALEDLLHDLIKANAPVELEYEEDDVRPSIDGAALSRHARSLARGQALALRGVHIDGSLDLAYRAIAAPLRFEDCTFTGTITLDGANLTDLRLLNSRFPALSARHTIASGRLDLSGIVAASLDLSGARIAGDLLLSDAEIQADQDVSAALIDPDLPRGAIVANQVAVDGAIVADELICEAGLQLNDATVGRTLDLTGAHLSATRDVGWIALDLDGAEIPRVIAGVTEDGTRCSLKGAMTLRRAKIEQLLAMSGARIAPVGEVRFAINADRAELGEVSLDADRPLDPAPVELAEDGLHYRFLALGEVQLNGATLSGRLHLSGAELHDNGTGDALSGDGLTAAAIIASSTLPLHSRGTFRLLGATVHDVLDLDAAQITSKGAYGALAIARTSVAGSLRLAGASISGPEDSAEHGEPPIAIYADELQCSQFEAAGLSARGAVLLRGVASTGTVVMSGADLAAQAGEAALHAERLKASDVDLVGATVRGEVVLVAAAVDGVVDFGAATLDATGGERALSMDRAKLGDLVGTGDDPTEVIGELRLPDATITNAIDLRGVTIRPAGDGRTSAIFADGATSGRLDLATDDHGRGFTALGRVSFARATVRGITTLVGATLNGRGGRALDFARADLGEVNAAPSPDGVRTFSSTGELRFASATIRGTLDLSGTTLHGRPTALDADGVTVEDLLLGVAPRGAHFIETRVGGEIRLMEARVSGALVLGGADLQGDGPTALWGDRARVGSILGAEHGEAALCVAGSIRLVEADIENSVILDGAKLSATGADAPLILAGASVRRDLSLQGASLTGAPIAIEADRSTLGSVRLDGDEQRPTRLDGAASFGGATVQGQFVLDGAKVTVTSRSPAVVLRDAHVHDDVLMNGVEVSSHSVAVAAHGLRAKRLAALPEHHWHATFNGAVLLPGAQIDDVIDLAGATISALGAAALNLDGVACRSIRLCSSRGVVRFRTTIEGEVRAINARVDDQLDLSGALITAHRADAVTLDRAHLTSVLLGIDGDGHPTTLVGTFRLLGASVRDELRIVGCELARHVMTEGPDVVMADGAKAGELILQPNSADGRLSFLGFDTRRLRTASGPEAIPGSFDLTGLTYTRWDLLTEQQVPAGWQLEIVQRHAASASSLQPYEHLAATLRGQGEERLAREVLRKREQRVTALARTADRTRSGWRRHWNSLRRCSWLIGRWLYGAVVGYGYRGIMPAVLLGVLWLLSTCVVVEADRAGAIEAKSAPSITLQPSCISMPLSAQGDCLAGRVEEPRASPKVNPLVYGAERVLPAVDFGERSRVHVTGGWGLALGGVTLLGWIFTIALLAALNKTLRRD